MYGGFGRGRGASARGGIGFGFRGSSPPWPYVGRGRGGFPRCGYYTGTAAVTGSASGDAPMTREDELNCLKDRAKAIQDDLERINSRMRDLESKK